jgi:hypothetical protein
MFGNGLNWQEFEKQALLCQGCRGKAYKDAIKKTGYVKTALFKKLK